MKSWNLSFATERHQFLRIVGIPTTHDDHRLDLAEQAELRDAMDRAWAGLPESYQFLKNWEYI